MQWYIHAIKKYGDFNGRARRKEFWSFFLFNFSITLVLGIIDISMSGLSQKITFGLLSLIYVLAVLLPSLGVSVRRLHDIDRSGWWLLVGLIPLVGHVVLLLFCVKDSHPGYNPYGASPKYS